MKKLSLFASVSLLTTTFSLAGGEGWMHDMEAAKEKAAKENKSLLIDFTGSDWCGWCIKLNEEVFSHEPFKKGVADKYVLVELDYPQDKSILDEETIKQNAELQKVYQIQGFPTILLADAQGRPFAKTGYQAGGPEAYLTHLAELQEAKTTRDKAFEKAKKEEGVAKAKALYAGLEAVPEDYRSLYPTVIEEIIALDPKDETGLAASQKAFNALLDLEKSLQTAMQAGDTAKAVELVDAYVAEQDPEPAKKQELLAIKINILLQKGEFDAVEKVLDEIIAVDPDSPISSSVKAFRENQLPKIKADAAAKEAKEDAPETPEKSE